MRRLGTFLAVITAALLSGGALPASARVAPSARQVVEYQIPSTGVPEGIAAGSDGALWFSERYTTQVGRVTVGGQFRVFSFSQANHMSTDITAGPDGALWFTFPNSVPPNDTGKIGRITTAGQSTFFQIPWVSDPESITTGSDGNLWFADHVAAAIGRITTGGVFTKFAIPGSPGFYPWQIASGPDGALWFTDFNGHRVGRLTTDGQLSLFSTPTEAGYPDAIAAGPDGNVWFTFDDEATIGRITPEGVITQYPVPHAQDDYVILGGITPLSGTTLAFTFWDIVTGESRIGRITTSGAISTVPTPSPNSSPLAITSGPAGGVWFTEVGIPAVAGILRGSAPR